MFSDDVVHLNVGGTHLSCSRSTLGLVPDSMLALQFGPGAAWRSATTATAASQEVFVDADPEVFQVGACIMHHHQGSMGQGWYATAILGCHVHLALCTSGAGTFLKELRPPPRSSITHQPQPHPRISPCLLACIRCSSVACMQA